MIYQHSFLFTLKGFCQLYCLLLKSNKKLGIGFEFAEQLLSSGDRMISIEGFHGFVVWHICRLASFVSAFSLFSNYSKVVIRDIKDILAG